MYVLPRSVMDLLAPPSDPERTPRQQRAVIFPSEVNTVDHPPQDNGEQLDSTENTQSDHMAAADPVDRAPYPTRMRVILILSILSWMMVALAIVWAISSL